MNLKGFEDSVALHVVQWHAEWIGTPCFFAGLHMVTGHIFPFVPLFEALANLFVPPHTKVCIHVVSKTMMACLLLLLRVFAVKLW